MDSFLRIDWPRISVQFHFYLFAGNYRCSIMVRHSYIHRYGIQLFYYPTYRFCSYLLCSLDEYSVIVSERRIKGSRIGIADMGALKIFIPLFLISTAGRDTPEGMITILLVYMIIPILSGISSITIRMV